jgi:transposase InsO family protein
MLAFPAAIKIYVAVRPWTCASVDKLRAVRAWARAFTGVAGRHRNARLMRQERLQARRRSKYRPRTTDGRHDDPIAPNRLLTVVPNRRDQVWVTDATYLLTGPG